MAKKILEPLLLVTSEAELLASDSVWGTGGWLQPEGREALDWLTLARLMGWGVRLTRPTRSGFDGSFSGGRRWVVLACDPECLDEEFVTLLVSRLRKEPILVVARAGASDGPLARVSGAVQRPELIAGRSLRWTGPGSERSWYCRKVLGANVLEISKETVTWTTLESQPIIAARRVGQGMVATLGFHPSRARDTDGAATALLRHLLVWGAAGPVAWLDFEGSLILRMDDPGGAQNVYLRSYSYPKLSELEWAAVGADLRRRNARMSIGYVAGWVDDGDPARGVLKVAGHPPARIPGEIYHSPLVQYQDLAGHAPGTSHDYESEYRGIQSLRAAGLAEVELHGYTHLHSDRASWANAPDRYEAMSWYRELGKTAAGTIAARPLDQHPLSLGVAGFRRYFDVFPTTLICPGDQWTHDVLERALGLGIQFISSYYLAIRHEDGFCWAQHVCAPYLDQPGSAWFGSGLPVVGYFHDRDVALEGVGWMSRWLDLWQDAGVKRFMDFRELASAVGRRLHVEEHNGELRFLITSEGAPALVRPLRIAIRLTEGRVLSHVSVNFDDRDLSLEVHPDGEGLGRVIVPPSSNSTGPVVESTPVPNRRGVL